jgi:hypothetical protein
MSPSVAEPDLLRRRIAHQLFQKFAFASFVIWTASCFLIFITFAAGNSRPVFPAMLSMTAPLIPAALIWLAYRPMVAWLLRRRLAAGPASQAGRS